MLVQYNKDDGLLHFISRKLLTWEQAYSTIEKEMLAIVWAITKFRHYLVSQHFLLQTHHSLLELMDHVTVNQKTQMGSSWYSFSMSYILKKVANAIIMPMGF